MGNNIECCESLMLYHHSALPSGPGLVIPTLLYLFIRPCDKNSLNKNVAIFLILSNCTGFIIFKQYTDLQSTQRPHDFMSADSHSLSQSAQRRDQLNCICAILKPRGAVEVVRGGKHCGLPLVQVISVVLVWQTKTLIFFYLRTNNATK